MYVYVSPEISIHIMAELLRMWIFPLVAFRLPSPSLCTCFITDALLSDPTVVQWHDPRLTTDDTACKLLSDVPWAAKDRTLVSLLVSELRIIVTVNITHLPVTDYNVTITSSYIVL